MDLSANGFPPHHPSHIWHLHVGPSRPLSFPVAPPLALSGRYEREGLVLFTSLTGVLLSSQMINEASHLPIVLLLSVKIIQKGASPLNDVIERLHLTAL